MNLCKDCKHHENRYNGVLMEWEHDCKALPITNAVTGELTYRDCEDARKRWGPCAPAAKLFELEKGAA